MKLLEFARGSAFWILDSLKGKKVKSALETLRKCEDGVWSEEEVKQYQEEQIQKLLSHAKTTVPFYGNQKDTILRNWPVVNKNILRSNGDDLISNEFSKDNLIAMTTSGSTGTPFTSWQDSVKKKHVNAETLYYNGKVGFSIGRRIIYLRSIVSEVSKSSIQQFAQNIYLLDCNDLSDEGIQEKLKFIVDYSKGCGAMLMGYASTFTAFQKYFDKYGYEEVARAKIYGIASGSEMLYDATRETLEKAFHCQCVSRYANEENGFLGQDDEENNVFFMNRADYYVEVLKMDSDEPADEGEVGRLVVTDFFNYAMPMIRYDTGDVGAVVTRTYKGFVRKAIGEFGGRIVDAVTDINGNLVSPHAITNTMWRHSELKQFQFIQKSAGRYVLLLNAEKNSVDEAVLIEGLKKYFGNESEISINYCDEIPAMASGKRRYIVNEEKK